jgi:hypothetical protein
LKKSRNCKKDKESLEKVQAKEGKKDRQKVEKWQTIGRRKMASNR